jgi:hypothetical protein
MTFLAFAMNGHLYVLLFVLVLNQILQDSSQEDYRFELVSPSEGESMCIQGGSLNLEYVFISSTNIAKDHRLEYTVSAKRFTTRASNSRPLDITLTAVGSIPVSLGDSERLREEGSVEMLLTYKLIDRDGDEVNGGSGSINFNAAFRDSCLSTNTQTPPSTAPSTVADETEDED